MLLILKTPRNGMKEKSQKLGIEESLDIITNMISQAKEIFSLIASSFYYGDGSLSWLI